MFVCFSFDLYVNFYLFALWVKMLTYFTFESHFEICLLVCILSNRIFALKEQKTRKNCRDKIFCGCFNVGIEIVLSDFFVAFKKNCIYLHCFLYVILNCSLRSRISASRLNILPNLFLLLKLLCVFFLFSIAVWLVQLKLQLY